MIAEFQNVPTFNRGMGQMVLSDIRDKAWTPFTFNICALQTPPSPNELLSKGYIYANIKNSAEVSHKTHAGISLQQRGNSLKYGLVYNLQKQMAVHSDKV